MPAELLRDFDALKGASDRVSSLAPPWAHEDAFVFPMPFSGGAGHLDIPLRWPLDLTNIDLPLIGGGGGTGGDVPPVVIGGGVGPVVELPIPLVPTHHEPDGPIIPWDSLWAWFGG